MIINYQKSIPDELRKKITGHVLFIQTNYKIDFLYKVASGSNRLKE